MVTGSSNALLMWNTLLMMLAPSEALKAVKLCQMNSYASVLEKQARPVNRGQDDLEEHICWMQSLKMGSLSIMKRQLSWAQNLGRFGDD